MGPVMFFSEGVDCQTACQLWWKRHTTQQEELLKRQAQVQGAHEVHGVHAGNISPQGSTFEGTCVADDDNNNNNNSGSTKSTCSPSDSDPSPFGAAFDFISSEGCEILQKNEHASAAASVAENAAQTAASEMLRVMSQVRCCFVL